MLLMRMDVRQLTALPEGDVDLSFGEKPLHAVVKAFSAGHAVPGSGSANALAASLAAALVASVARKTSGSEHLRYLSVRETANTIARQADRAVERLVELVDLDAKIFAPVIAIRRKTGKLSDPVLQDDSLRAEIASLRPATEIPQEIAERSIEIAGHAAKLFEIGFAPAKGESFTALASAIAAAESSLAVAQINVNSVRRRVADLNDPELEADWLERMRLRNQQLRLRIRPLKRQHVEFTRKLADGSPLPGSQPKRRTERTRKKLVQN